MSINHNDFREARDILIASKCECAKDYNELPKKQDELDKRGKQLLVDAYDEFKRGNRGNRPSKEQFMALTKASEAMGIWDLQYLLDKTPSVC